jgi:hypothetical protein
MFGFIKKLFGFDDKTLKDAGVQLEQVPYKVEAPVDVAVSQEPTPVAVAVDPTVNPVISTNNEVVVVKEVPAKSPKKPAPKKQGATPKQGTSGKPRGRRPKSKPASK